VVPDRRPGVFEHSRHSVWLFGMAFPVVVMGNNTWELFSSIDFLLITVFTVFTLHTHPFNGPFFRDYPGEPVPER